MSAANINVRVDSEIKNQAQSIFESMGLDMTTAINIFLRQAVRQRRIPFVITAEPARKMPKPGGWEGKIQMADDFDAPLEDFKEYME
ncbi:MAG: type II toxin-antitoxin system RelB/DinJ family antitoxin [Spirochaetota bacterium]|nr:type II toxin-antitoxin system RelB/DinJ family antitoxin [Spirochaetota bacterium]